MSDCKRTPITLQELVGYLHQYQLQLIANRKTCPNFDVEKWLNTMKVIDKLPIAMRMKVSSKILPMLQSILAVESNLDFYRVGYKLFHAIGDWFTLGHNQPIMQRNVQVVETLTTHFASSPKLPVVITMTSCKRFDLLSRTINSMIVNCTDITKHCCEWILIDDNSSEEDRKRIRTDYPFLTIIEKTPEQKGHPKSMNMLRERILTMNHVTYNFHIEDDFEWWYPDNYITKCLEVIKADKTYGQALVNFEYTEDQKSAIDIWNRDMQSTSNGLRYFVHEYYDTEERLKIEYNHIAAKCSMYWPHFSFRPGVTDIRVFAKLGAYSETHQHFEMDYAHRFVKAGYKTASLDCCYTTHIGRRTYERDSNMLNAYDLNKEQQFGSAPKTSDTQTSPQQPPQAPQQKQQSPPSDVQTILDNLASQNVDMIRMYVINLERRPERMVNFITKNNYEAPPYEVFAAVDGKKLKPNGKIQRIFETGDYNFRRGIVGCAYSHLQIWNKFLKTNSHYCVVVEDDIQLAPKFTEKLLYLLQTYGKSFDLMFLHFNLYPDWERRDKAWCAQHPTNPTDPAFDPISFECKAGLPSAEMWSAEKSMMFNMGSGAGYILTRRGAKHMLEFVDKHGMPNAVDWVLMKQPDLKIMYSKPKLIFADCWQNNQQIQSDIQTEYDSVKYQSDMEWLEDEIKYWMDQCKVKGNKLNISSSDLLKGCKGKYVHESNSVITVTEKINFKKDATHVKEQITIVPMHIEVSDMIPVKWYTVGSTYKVVVHDRFVSTKVYNDKVWGSHRVNFAQV
jgi:GR25 family glycosyltransferase involved in LPS biosynthesis